MRPFASAPVVALSRRVFTKRFLCFPDAHTDKHSAGALPCDLGREQIETDLGESFDGRIERLKLLAIKIEVFVVKTLDNNTHCQPFQLRECEGRSASHERRTDDWLKPVIVPVAVWIIALAKDLAILLVRERRRMEPMRRGELEPLREQHACHVPLLHSEFVCRTLPQCHMRHGARRQRRCDRVVHAQHPRLGRWRRLVLIRGQCRYGACSNRVVNRSNVDQVSGGGVRLTLTRDVDRQMGRKATRARKPRMCVGWLGNGVSGPSKGESNCADEPVHGF